MKQSSKPIRIRRRPTEIERCHSPDDEMMAISLGDYSNRRQPRQSQLAFMAEPVSHAGYLYKRSNQPYREVTPTASYLRSTTTTTHGDCLLPAILQPDDVEHLNKSELTTDSVVDEQDVFRQEWKRFEETPFAFGIVLPTPKDAAAAAPPDWFLPVQENASELSMNMQEEEEDEDVMDYIDPTNRHLWRAVYCVLASDALFFYRTQAESELPDAILERQQQFNEGDASVFEKCVSLNAVGTVRSAEQEHGANSFELVGEEKLILRAHDRNEMNQWLFQFHLCIASFVMDIVGSRSRKTIMEPSFLHYSPMRPRVVTAASFSPYFQKTVSTGGVGLSHGHGRHHSGRNHTGRRQQQRGQPEWLTHSARQTDELLPFPLDGARMITPLLPRQDDGHNTFPPELCVPTPSDTPETERPLPYVPPHRRNYVPRNVRQQQQHQQTETPESAPPETFSHGWGGCADPKFVLGSIMDDQFIPRKASRLQKVRTEPFGYQDDRIDVGAFSECGIRESNEDAFFVTSNLWRSFGQEPSSTESNNTSLFSIFDGHCGDQAARFAAEQLIRYMHQESLVLQPPPHAANLQASLVEIMERALLNMDKAFCEFCVEGGRDWESGATALVVALLDNTVTVANLGDARCIVGRTLYDADKVTAHETDGWVELPQDIYTEGRCLWKEITEIHSPNREDERNRIGNANGWITMEKEIPVGQLKRMAFDDDDVMDILQRCVADRYQPSPKASAPHRMLQLYRVCGELAVSRALGDRDFKAEYNRQTVDEFGTYIWDPEQLFLCYPDEHAHFFVGDLVSNQPEFTSVEVGHAAEEFLVLACDGLWDVLDPDDAYRVTHNLLYEKRWSSQEAAARLAELAVHLGSSDNITVIVVKFLQRDD